MKRSELKRQGGSQWRKALVALRGTVAALAALLAAMALHLENPYWAAMTALIVIQPTRGMLLEKSFYRVVGTVIGSLAGLLLLSTTRSPVLLTVALSLWVALCVGIGNLLHGFRSYAALLAACTCVVIAMSGYLNLSHLRDIALARVACILVGIVVSTLVAAFFTPRRGEDELKERLGQVVEEVVGWLALLLRRGRGADLARRERELLVQVAEIDSLLEGHRRFPAPEEAQGACAGARFLAPVASCRWTRGRKGA